MTNTYLLYDDESGLLELSADVVEAAMTAELTDGGPGGCCVSHGFDLSFMSMPEFLHCSKKAARNSCEA